MNRVDVETAAEAIAETIRAERAATRLSQAEVARRADMTRITYIRYERGERQPSFAQVIQIADALGVPLEVFVRRVEDRLRHPAPEPPLTMQELKQQRLLEAAMPVDIAADDRPWVGDGADDWEPC